MAGAGLTATSLCLTGKEHYLSWMYRLCRGVCSSELQEELLLSLVVAMAISWLLLSLRKDSAQDYAFACFFLICTTSLLKVRWLLGTLALTLPLLLVYGLRLLRPAQGPSVLLPRDADVHLTVAWATGALMSFVADSYRRFVHISPLHHHAMILVIAGEISDM